MSGHGPHLDPENKKIALLIAVLALVLAFTETLGKSAQTAALNYNVEASNLWSFFQAKTIRLTAVRTAAEMLAAQGIGDRSREGAGREVARRRRALRLRAGDRRGPQGACGARQGRRGEARSRAGRLPPLRDRLRRGADRHRARVGDHHHRRRSADVACGGPRRGGHRIRTHRLVRAAGGASVLRRRPTCAANARASGAKADRAAPVSRRDRECAPPRSRRAAASPGPSSWTPCKP